MICFFSEANSTCSELFSGRSLTFIDALDEINFDLGYTLFSKKLDQLVAINSVRGVTATDRELAKFEKKLLALWNTHLEGRDQVHMASLRILAYKLRTTSLLRDKEFLKTLTFKEKMYAEQMYQDKLIFGIQKFLDDAGIPIRSGWSLRNLAGDFWWNILMQWNLIEFGIFPKIKSAIGNGQINVDFFWNGPKNSGQIIKLRDLFKIASNKVIHAWHYAFYAGVITFATVWVMEVKALSNEYSLETEAATQKTVSVIANIADRVADPNLELRFSENVEFESKKLGRPLSKHEQDKIRKKLADEQLEYERLNRDMEN